MTIRKIAAVALSCFAALMTITAPSASAAPNGNIVTIGDSYFANPDLPWHVLHGVAPELVPAHIPTHAGCVGAEDNFSVQLGATTGRPVADFSCAGMTSMSMNDRLQLAIDSGELHPGTHAVVLGVGFNDIGPNGIIDRASRGQNDPSAAGSEMNAEMRRAADKIRSVAPGARIQLLGMPEIVDANGFLCPLQVTPDQPAGFWVSRLGEDTVAQLQADAARSASIDFVDMRAATAGRGTCSTPDHLRHVSGIIDFTSPQWHFVFHPTVVGSQAMARESAARL